ncbi:MAG: (2Fe-2S)-binding protein [Halobacteriales archaeon]
MSSGADHHDPPDASGDADPDGLLGGVSRRDLIKGTLGGVIVGANAYLFDNVRKAVADTDEAPGVRDRFSGSLQLTVNGRRRNVNVEDQERLLETLRYKLGLTGSKFGCDRAMCGACTVLVDGEPIYGCTYFTRDAVGKEITTIEGLESNGSLHPLQEAFLEDLGGQCAFCTPGMILTGLSIIDEHGDPSREAVKAGLSGNLCRCGNYENEISAVMKAARRM